MTMRDRLMALSSQSTWWTASTFSRGKDWARISFLNTPSLPASSASRPPSMRPDGQLPSPHTTWCSRAWRPSPWAAAGRSTSATPSQAGRCASRWCSSVCLRSRRRNRSQWMDGRLRSSGLLDQSPRPTSTTLMVSVGTAPTRRTTCDAWWPCYQGGTWLSAWRAWLGYHRS